jgi:hypothetical protein
VARPIPSLPPVIAATLPCNPRSMRPFRLLIGLTLFVPVRPRALCQLTRIGGRCQASIALEGGRSMKSA